jgi:hypothetical protein
VYSRKIHVPKLFPMVFANRRAWFLSNNDYFQGSLQAHLLVAEHVKMGYASLIDATSIPSRI